MKRKMSVVIGDYSKDGHNQCETYLVKIKGEDVSDEALQESFDKSNAEFGLNLYSLLKEYEDSYISPDIMDKFFSAGFNPERQTVGPFFYWEEGVFCDEGEASIIALTMWYIGRNINGFEWKSIDPEFPALMGGWNPAIKSKTDGDTMFGYGLFE